MITIKSLQEIELMRQAGRIVASTLRELAKAVKPGVTTMQLDTLARRHIEKLNARPAFLGYQGFPASICASVNEEVVHGIPGPRRLEAGDIISIDVGAYFKGYYGDAAATFPVEKVSPLAERLMKVTKDSLFKGIEKARPGNHLYDISAAVQGPCRIKRLSVVRKYVGHGIGTEMHEEPQVPNSGLGRGPLLEAGMVLAIEPMVNTGTWDVKTLDDGWTVIIKDGSLSAHLNTLLPYCKMDGNLDLF